MKKKKVWYDLSFRYNQKLSDLFNNKGTREELINFIEIKAPLHPAAKLLKTDIVIPCCSTEKIMIFKNDYNSIYYWVIKFKDSMLMFVKSIRPKFHFKVPCHIYPSSIIMAIDPMIQYWFKFNQNMNLYLIKFNFKSHKKLNIQYKTIFNEWSSCVRLLNDSGPYCQHTNFGFFN